MRILMFSDSFGTPTTTFIRNELNYLIAKHNVKYVCLPHEIVCPVDNLDYTAIQFSEKRLKKVIRRIKWKLGLSISFQNSEYRKKLSTVLNEFEPEIIHCHFGYESLRFFHNTNFDRLKNRSAFVHFHGYDGPSMLQYRSYRKAIAQVLKKKNVQALFASTDMAQKVVKALGPINNYKVFRCGIDTDFFKPIPIGSKPNAPFIFIQISSLSPKKGHEFSLKAIEKLLKGQPSLRDSIKFVFTGDGQRKHELEILCTEYGIQDVVTFVGTVSREEALKLLAGANAFLHPSVTPKNKDCEAITNSIMEAMSMELPIVSTYHGGIPEIIEHGVNGLLCREWDVEALASNLLEILNWPKLKVNRQKVINEFSLQRHTEELNLIYESSQDT